MSVPIPEIAGAVTPARDAVPWRATVAASMHSPRAAVFFAILWTAVGLAIAAAQYASTLLGAPRMHPQEYPFAATIYILWVPFVPWIVRLARRFAPVRGRRLRVALIHLGLALPCILVKLVAHRLVFCAGFTAPYLDCVTAIRLESWLVHWLQTEYFVVAATVAGVWAFDASERAHQRELAVAEQERELAAAELAAAQGTIAPGEMTALLTSIAGRLHDDRAEAERMITRVADSLRLTVQRMRG